MLLVDYSNSMLLTIITSVFNAKDTIEQCLLSVLCQTHDNIEHLVVDGGSDDGTAEIVERYRDRIAGFVSEPDEGIYHAMNKGIRLATGDIVGFLNADDFYADRQVLADVVRIMEKTRADCCYGDLEYVQKGDTRRVMRKWKSGPYEEGLFERGWHPPHPSFFVRKEIFDRYGMFDTSFDIASDYELMLRFLKKHKIKWCYLPRVLVKMRTGGTSAGSLRQILKANIESYRAWKKNGLQMSPLIMVRKPFLYFKQYGRK